MPPEPERRWTSPAGWSGRLPQAVDGHQPGSLPHDRPQREEGVVRWLPAVGVDDRVPAHERSYRDPDELHLSIVLEELMDIRPAPAANPLVDGRQPPLDHRTIRIWHARILGALADVLRAKKSRGA